MKNVENMKQTWSHQDKRQWRNSDPTKTKGDEDYWHKGRTDNETHVTKSKGDKKKHRKIQGEETIKFKQEGQIHIMTNLLQALLALALFYSVNLFSF